ncbi:MAG: carbamoyltransferase HypF [bacterium]
MNVHKADHPGSTPQSRHRLEIRGQVQGVGFRPMVYRLAEDLGLTGFVGNNADGVFLEIEGRQAAVETFPDQLAAALPPLAQISEVTRTVIALQYEGNFRIVPSGDGSRPKAAVTPDMGCCPDCLFDINDPANRRYRYPFTNCTNCGPRYSIIQRIPYDRLHTTMSRFQMCPDCQAEYDDPRDRRFHAQPNACPLCGPHVWLVDRHGQLLAGSPAPPDSPKPPGDWSADPVRICAQLLDAERIVAIKGLGGFHLACRADSDRAVRTLRERKGRETKPLALMVGSLAAARALVQLGPETESLLLDQRRPIVLLPRRPGTAVSADVAPDSHTLGVMLPYTPLHWLLFSEGLGPLVMTSGNPSSEPICCGNEEALAGLSHIADALLLHDRDIERRVDDSVIQWNPALGGNGSQPLRRARGFAPAPVDQLTPAPIPILAVGGDLKSTVCLHTEDRTLVSEHLGDLFNPTSYRNFVRTVTDLQVLFAVTPELVVCDSHPAYASTRYARSLDLPRLEIQHHFAHVVSCLADNQVDERVIGVACDGTGYGDDGAIWGCELLLADRVEYSRCGHLDYFPLAGGDLAARFTWRPAVGLLKETYGASWLREVGTAGTLLANLDPEDLEITAATLERPDLVTPTSSLGRLCDAAACFLGLCGENFHEAEAPQTLEAVAETADPAVPPLAYGILAGDNGPTRIDYRPMIRDLLERQRDGQPVARIARAFFLGISAALAEVIASQAAATGLTKVALTGGCFANRLLCQELVRRCRKSGLEILSHHQVPAGDGGLALGQAVIAATRRTRGLS